MRRGCGAAAILIVVLQFPATLRGQSNVPSAPRLEVSAAVSWIGAISQDIPDAFEEDRDGKPYLLFATESEIRQAVAYGARIGLRLTGRLHVETGVFYSKPELVVHVSEDVEGAEDATVGDAISQFQVDVGMLAQLTRVRPGQRTIPFATAGAGYLRELHEEQTLLVTGRSYYLGGGLKRILTIRQGSSLRAAGVRVDGRLVARSKGAGFDDRVHLAPSFGGSLFFSF